MQSESGRCPHGVWVADHCWACNLDGSKSNAALERELAIAKNRLLIELEAPTTIGTQSAVAPIIPAGWRLVPIEPTTDMVNALHHGTWEGEKDPIPGHIEDRLWRQTYTAVLAVAPEAPAVQSATRAILPVDDVLIAKAKLAQECGGEDASVTVVIKARDILNTADRTISKGSK
jgi:hypothetical protein